MDTFHYVVIYGTYTFLFLVTGFIVMITLGEESSPHDEKESLEKARARKPRQITDKKKAQSLRIAQLRRRYRCGGAVLRHRTGKGAW